jgi:NADH-quinone oxidoreductase subunit M
MLPFIPHTTPILSLVIAIPLMSMAASWLTRSNRQAFLVGIVGAVLELAVIAVLFASIDSGNPAFQLTERIQVTPFLAYHLGVDGISLVFLALTGFLTLLVMLYGEIVDERPAGVYVASVFAFQSVLVALFLCIDLLEFWVVCVLELIPGTFILARWGEGPDKTVALKRYTRDMMGGLGLMLAAIVILGWHRAEISGDWSFALSDLLATRLPASTQSLVFVLMFYGLAVRLALFPFHAWLPTVAQHGPLATLCVFLVGLKAGIYTFLRFVLPLLPDAAREWSRFVVILATVGMFYGALLALMQINLRRLLAYAAVSQTGMLITGIFCLNTEGMQGSLLLAIDFGAASAGLLFATGILYRCTGTTYLPRLGGMFDRLPLIGLSFLLAALSTMAMPGTPGFDAAHLVLEGAIGAHHWGLAVAVAAGSVASAAFLLWAFQRAFLAHDKDRHIHRLTLRLSVAEVVLVAALCSVLIGVGFYSQPWLEVVGAPLHQLADRLDSGAGRAH